MTTTYHISGDELNEEFLTKLQQVFGNKKLLITVEEDEDDSIYLLSSGLNREKFVRSLDELSKGELVPVTLDELRK